MALLNCRYYSDVLEMSTTATVILPQTSHTQIGANGTRHGAQLPVLYLLHGMTDDDSIWTRRTSIERYVEQMGIAVVMPNVHRSFYTDQALGYDYWTHISEEMPAIMASFFPIDHARERTFVAGLSMGGYGAMKLALRHPDRYGAAASLSGALDVVNREPYRQDEWERTFQTPELARAQGNDLLELLRASAPSTLPPLYAWCGLDDWLLQDSRSFHRVATKHEVAIDYHESEGDHDWASWDAQIKRVLEWLPRADA